MNRPRIGCPLGRPLAKLTPDSNPSLGLDGIKGRVISTAAIVASTCHATTTTLTFAVELGERFLAKIYILLLYRIKVHVNTVGKISSLVCVFIYAALIFIVSIP